MHRFYVSSQNISGNKIIISDKAQAHHLKDVLRLKKNDAVKAFDEKGNEYSCLIKEFLNEQVSLEIKSKELVNPNKVKLTVACAIPKKSMMDDIIDKLTQLDVQRIIPLKTQRVLIKLDKDRENRKLSRWRKIAQSASQQCQRNTLPVIDTIKSIREVLSEAKNFDLRLIPTLTGERKPLKELFASSKPNNILALIGPEGDFSEEEVREAKKSGCIPVTLGDLVLRVDTAAVAVASFIKLYANS